MFFWSLIVGIFVSNHGIKELARNCSEIEEISFSGCLRIFDVGVKALAEGCPMLRVFLRLIIV